jgi:hypothetical protein
MTQITWPNFTPTDGLGGEETEKSIGACQNVLGGQLNVLKR